MNTALKRLAVLLAACVLIGCSEDQPQIREIEHGEVPILFTHPSRHESGFRIESIYSINSDGSRRDTVYVGASAPMEGSAYPPGIKASFPTWSPDYSLIAFSGYWGDPDAPIRTNARGIKLPTASFSDIFLINPDGTGIRRITDDPYGDSSPDFSPDGSRIAYDSRRDGNRDIFVVDTFGSEPLRLTDNPGYDWGPDWSPDGAEIVFTSDREGRPGLYIMNADGSDVRWLAAGRMGSWSPDGKRIAFDARTCAMIDPLGRDDDEACQATGTFGVNGNIAIFLINPDGSHLKRVWPPDGQTAPVRSPDGKYRTRLGGRPLYPVWSPDGSMLAFHGASPFYAKDPALQDEMEQLAKILTERESELSEKEREFLFDNTLERYVSLFVVDTLGVDAVEITIDSPQGGGGGHPEWFAAGGK